MKNKLLPTALKIAPKTIAQDIVGYDPSNPRDVERWNRNQKELYQRIKEGFDEKGIPMPEVIIDTSPGPAKPPVIT